CRLAWRRVSPRSSDYHPSSCSLPTNSSPVHSSGLDAPDQAHSGSSTRVISPRLGYPPMRALRQSEAFRRWCADPLSTFYTPTTLESSLGDSSERPLHSSSYSVGPSRKRYRSSANFLPSSTLVMGSLAPTHTDLLPIRKRLRDSYSSETNMEKDTEIDNTKTEDGRELDIVDRDDARDCVEIVPRDVRDNTEEYEADTSAGDTFKVGINLMSAPVADEESKEPIGEDSSNSSGTRDGIVRSFKDMLIDLDDVVHEFYHHMSEGGNGNGDGRGDRPIAHECTYQDFMKCQPLSFKGTEGVVGLIRWKQCFTSTIVWKDTRFQELTMMFNKMVPEEEDRVEKFIGGLPNNIQGNVIATEPIRLQDNTGGQNVARAYTAGNNEKMDYGGPNQRAVTCFEYGTQGHYQKDCTKVNNQNRRNKARVPDARGKAYVIGGGDANPGFNTVTGTFLINDHHAYMLFDLGAARSFVTNIFSTLLDITPSALDVSYAVELADERTSKTSIVLTSCTLGLLGHPFNIDLMPIDLGSFDVINNMDWLAKNHAVIVCDEKIVRIPNENEILIVQGDQSDKGKKSTLSIISCLNTQKYMEKDCQVFLA
nr:hypothetical protein [Tanacetum cinerariifolium]